jgi:hypothetical protein
MDYMLPFISPVPNICMTFGWFPMLDKFRYSIASVSDSSILAFPAT